MKRDQDKESRIRRPLQGKRAGLYVHTCSSLARSWPSHVPPKQQPSEEILSSGANLTHERVWRLHPLAPLPLSG